MIFNTERGYYISVSDLSLKGKVMSFNNENNDKIEVETNSDQPTVEENDIVVSDTADSESEIEKRTNPVIKKLCYFRDAVTVDFEKPFTFTDQLIIMFVILFISCLLFGFVFLVARMTGSAGDDEFADVNTESNISTAISDEPEGNVEEAMQSSVNRSSVSDDVSDSSTSQVSSKKAEEKTKSDPLFNECEIRIENSKKSEGMLILVNKDCRCESDGENVISLMKTDNIHYDVTDVNVSFDKDKVVYLNKMLEDFYNIFGDTDIMIACGYRGYDMQARLYNQEIENLGSESAELWVAPPGHSEHQTGLSFDFNLNLQNGSGGIQYRGEDVYSWLNDNCFKYGFIVRYMLGKEKITGYEYEPWHFRYVGEAAATYMYKNELTLEEYLDIVHTHSIKDPLIIEGEDNKKWCAYYIKASTEDETTLTVPYDRDYEISGDNYSGFIITVEL